MTVFLDTEQVALFITPLQECGLCESPGLVAGAFTARDWVQSQVGELRSWKPPPLPPSKGLGAYLWMKVLYQYVDLSVFSDSGSQVSSEDLWTPNILSKQYHILKEKKEGKRSRTFLLNWVQAITHWSIDQCLPYQLGNVTDKTKLSAPLLN